MIDLHTHTFLSDGALVPAEQLRRVEVLGYQAVAITDHADSSNMDFLIPRIVQAAKDLNRHSKTRLIPGIELTHVPPPLIASFTKKARELGAQVVVVHGETITEPVAPGTNRAALEAGVDVLSHPGMLSEEDAKLAAEKKIFLELTGRKGHSLTNGHVATLGARVGAPLAVNADAHSPGDFLTKEMARLVALGAGVTEEDYAKIRASMADFVAGLAPL
ncbi:MAG: histidinol phosphate phosphatase domain-containing protein [Thermodesulfobacteriota bacterium]